ncbi:globin family protein [Terasakiella sp. A23]|uniref:globin family protein n=1 Tax=Terasakiella sp. FCG-A23 TaxID=3080561 RepID=UPI002952FE09|nr:globin family protein [Terasakiella sp. A23]MDV7340875.1 globin family protein [Terasakiella sp. A23]
MTPETIKLVQDSFQKVVPIADTAADIFYTHLFETSPELRPLFPNEMASQKVKLMQVLGGAIANLHQVDSVIASVQDLGRRHVAYGVTDEHYDLVGASLLYTLEKGLGPAWNDDLADAWTEVYATVATVMKAAAAEVEAAE